jgi:Protein of unknown function (DUF2865)
MFLPPFFPGRPLRRLAMTTAFILASLSLPAAAQSYDCERLRQEMASASRPDPQRTGQSVRELQRQRIQLSRTQAYADQIGCKRGFLIFGGGGPPQCDGILAQIDRMTNNVDALQQQVTQGDAGDAGREAALLDQYRTYCRTDPSAQNSDELPGDPMRPGLGNDDADQPSEGGVRRYGKAVCVRTCDGGFFPLSFAPAQRDTSGLQSLCTALCPNTEVKLYTTPDMDNVGAAVSIDGASYSDLPNAFKYQKSFDPTCSCKPPNKSWVEALADAEKLLDQDHAKDVLVTAKMSDDMARPVASTPAALPPGKGKKSFDKAQIKAILDAQAAAEGALGAVGAQAPTAGTESAGIANERGGGGRVVKTDEGEVKTVAGPDGAKRRVRVVGPAL